MGGWAKEGWNPTFKETQHYTKNSPPGPRQLSLWSKRKWKLKEGQGITQCHQAKGRGRPPLGAWGWGGVGDKGRSQSAFGDRL